jgi:hypothetical protein
MLRTIVLVLCAIALLAFFASSLAGKQVGSNTEKELERLYVEALGKESLSDYRQLFHPASVQAALVESSRPYENYFEYHFRMQVSAFSRMSHSWRKALSEQRFHLRRLPDDTGLRQNSLRFEIPPTHLLTYSNVDGRMNLVVLEEYAVFEEGKWMLVAPLPRGRGPERPHKPSSRS